jgi:hypothetical protein
MTMQKIAVLFVFMMGAKLVGMEQSGSPKEDKPLVTILLLGKTGWGKSTLANLFINLAGEKNVLDRVFAIPTDFHECNVEAFKHKAVENFSRGTTYSVTAEPTDYVVEGPNYILKIIDTPGLANTQGVEQDEKNTAAIAKFVAESGGFNAICIVLPSTTIGTTAEQRYTMSQLQTIMPRGARDRIFILVTHATLTSGDPKNFIEQFELPTTNSFYFDNLPLSHAGIIPIGAPTERNAMRNDPERMAMAFENAWSDAKEEFSDFINKALSFSAYSTDEMEKIGALKSLLVEEIAAGITKLEQLESNDSDVLRHEMKKITARVVDLYLNLGTVSISALELDLGGYYDMLIKIASASEKPHLERIKMFYEQVAEEYSMRVWRFDSEI